MRADLLLLLVAVALFAGCAADTPSTTTTPEGADGDTNTLPPAVAAAVSLFDRTPGVGVPPTTMGIDPATLELSVGVPVDLTVTNDGASVHNLVIDGLDVATDDLDAGASATATFTPLEAGDYVMYCSIGGDGPLGHRAQGMVGTVTVA